MTKNHALRRRVASQSIVLVATVLVVCSCSKVKEEHVLPHSAGLTGKKQSAILACAGPPNQEVKTEDAVIWRYYKEAPMFEESSVASKGSIPRLHRGCWANLLVENERIAGVELRAVPDAEAETEDCKAIFASCGP